MLNVPVADIPKDVEFYTNCMGMKVIYNQPADPAKKQNPQVFMTLGRNTLYLRPTSKPDDKPYCNHFAFVCDDYDEMPFELRGIE